MRLLRSCLLILACLPPAAEVGAQGLPTEPISLAGGRFVFGGELFANFGSADPGWFNYTDYEYSAFRNLRVSLTSEVRLSTRLQVLGELRLDHADRLSAYALFLRIRPWAGRSFRLHVGRVPPTFGALARTLYAYENLVIGQPLAYQYLLSIRPDAVPASADDLIAMRGRGWRSQFPIGASGGAPGVPVVNTLRFDTGVQAHGVLGRLEWTGALTQGSLSDPRVVDNNGRPQVATRVRLRLHPGVRIGGSLASGPWLDRNLAGAATSIDRVARFRQSAVGLDAEVSADRWLMRGEWLRATWQLPPPVNGSTIETPAASSAILEGRYRLLPGLTLAARGDALWFSSITSSRGPQPWEAAVRRLEAAVAVAVTRNLSVRAGWQRNRRDGGRVRHDSLLAAQVLYWF